ncbi:MAG: BrnT family toxin, partial [gamma proteobacterium symbiont of Bathyaustriella thionipta]|nr:BrnT family toxin [gamma proteobacterium symbiont of Bathyaustriella thionipta]
MYDPIESETDTGSNQMEHLVGVVVYIERSADVIRIISARKANKREVKNYLITPMAQPCSTTAEALEVYVVQHKQA